MGECILARHGGGLMKTVLLGTRQVTGTVYQKLEAAFATGFINYPVDCHLVIVRVYGTMSLSAPGSGSLAVLSQGATSGGNRLQYATVSNTTPLNFDMVMGPWGKRYNSSDAAKWSFNRLNPNNGNGTNYYETETPEMLGIQSSTGVTLTVNITQEVYGITFGG